MKAADRIAALERDKRALEAAVLELLDRVQRLEGKAVRRLTATPPVKRGIAA